MSRKQTFKPSSSIADLQNAAKDAAENSSFEKGLDPLARKPDIEKPTFGEKTRLRTPDEQRAEIERVARKRGVELGDDASEQVLREVARVMKE